MLVTLRNTSSITLDLDAEVMDRATVTQQLGRRMLRIPHTSPAWDEAYINSAGGTFVEFFTGRQIARGIADRPQIRRGIMELAVYPPEQWFAIRYVSTNRQFRSVPAGAIAMNAVRDGVLGLGTATILPGSIVIGAPAVTMDFSGQTVLQVLQHLTDASGQTWMLDNDMRFHWVAQQGRYH
jgi:hypothetical protein